MSEVPREFRAETYALAAQEHITVILELHESQRYVLSHYVAGLSVECLLKAFKSRLDSALDERHDLRRLANKGRFFDHASEKQQPGIAAALGEIVTRWANGHRYRSESALRRFLTKRRLFARKGDVLKNSSRKIVNAALELVTFGAQKWQT